MPRGGSHSGSWRRGKSGGGSGGGSGGSAGGATSQLERKFRFPAQLAGHVYGRGYKNVVRIRDESGARLHVISPPELPEEERIWSVCVISGASKAVEAAIKELKSLVEMHSTRSGRGKGSPEEGVERAESAERLGAEQPENAGVWRSTRPTSPPDLPMDAAGAFEGGRSGGGTAVAQKADVTSLSMTRGGDTPVSGPASRTPASVSGAVGPDGVGGGVVAVGVGGVGEGRVVGVPSVAVPPAVGEGWGDAGAVCRGTAQERAHVLLDLSGVALAIQHGPRAGSLRVDPSSLAALVRGGREPGSLIAVAAVDRRDGALQHLSNEESFDAVALEAAPGTDPLVEVRMVLSDAGVATVHASRTHKPAFEASRGALARWQASRRVFITPAAKRPPASAATDGKKDVLVIGTGFLASESGGPRSLTALAASALHLGWRVELWTFDSSHSPAVQTLARTFPNLLSIQHLGAYSRFFTVPIKPAASHQTASAPATSIGLPPTTASAASSGTGSSSGASGASGASIASGSFAAAAAAFPPTSLPSTSASSAPSATSSAPSEAMHMPEIPMDFSSIPLPFPPVASTSTTTSPSAAPSHTLATPASAPFSISDAFGAPSTSHPATSTSFLSLPTPLPSTTSASTAPFGPLASSLPSTSSALPPTSSGASDPWGTPLFSIGRDQ